MNWICKWFGHKRGVLKGKTYTCTRCGVHLIYWAKP